MTRFINIALQEKINNKYCSVHGMENNVHYSFRMDVCNYIAKNSPSFVFSLDRKFKLPNISDLTPLGILIPIVLKCPSC